VTATCPATSDQQAATKKECDVQFKSTRPVTAVDSNIAATTCTIHAAHTALAVACIFGTDQDMSAGAAVVHSCPHLFFEPCMLQHTQCRCVALLVANIAPTSAHFVIAADIWACCSSLRGRDRVAGATGPSVIGKEGRNEGSASTASSTGIKTAARTAAAKRQGIFMSSVYSRRLADRYCTVPGLTGLFYKCCKR
jgi:hypothetical protein